MQLLAPIDDATNHAQLDGLTTSGMSVMHRFEALIDREEAEAASRLDARQRSLNAARRTWFIIALAGMPLGMLVSLVVVAVYTQRSEAGSAGRRASRACWKRAWRSGSRAPQGRTRQLERVLVRSGTRVVELQGELRRMGTSDALTRLLNRRGFIPSAEHQLEVAKRTHQPMALAFLDLDGLKLSMTRRGMRQATA